MAKEFDIYLKSRLTECDIIVYSIPLRDGLTVVDRLILESLIRSYTLQKFVAIQTGSELVSHIDEMLKTCYERLNAGTKLNVDAQFQVHYAAQLPDAGMVLSAEALGHMATVFERAENAMLIEAAPLRVAIGKSVGSGSSALAFDSGVRNTLKRSNLSPNAGMTVGAELDGFEKRVAFHINSGVVPVAELTNLCYRVYRAAETSIAIAAEVLETEIHYSLGSGENTIELGAEVDDTVAHKYEAFENCVAILAEATEAITQFAAPEAHALLLGADASPIIRRYSMLSEVDEPTLADYAGMTLEDVGFIIL